MCECPFTDGRLCLYTAQTCAYRFYEITKDHYGMCIYTIPGVGEIEYWRYCGATITENTPRITVLSSGAEPFAHIGLWIVLLIVFLFQLR